MDRSRKKSTVTACKNERRSNRSLLFVQTCCLFFTFPLKLESENYFRFINSTVKKENSNYHNTSARLSGFFGCIFHLRFVSFVTTRIGGKKLIEM